MSRKSHWRFWLRLGYFLPDEVRRRLFEPAYYDVVREHLSRTSDTWIRKPLAASVLYIFLSSSCHGLILLCRDRRRLQKIVRGLALTTIAVICAAAILLHEWILFLTTSVFR